VRVVNIDIGPLASLSSEDRQGDATTLVKLRLLYAGVDFELRSYR